MASTAGGVGPRTIPTVTRSPVDCFTWNSRRKTTSTPRTPRPDAAKPILRVGRTNPRRVTTRLWIRAPARPPSTHPVFHVKQSRWASIARTATAPGWTGAADQPGSAVWPPRRTPGFAAAKPIVHPAPPSGAPGCSRRPGRDPFGPPGTPARDSVGASPPTPAAPPAAPPAAQEATPHPLPASSGIPGGRPVGGPRARPGAGPRRDRPRPGSHRVCRATRRTPRPPKPGPPSRSVHVSRGTFPRDARGWTGSPCTRHGDSRQCAAGGSAQTPPTPSAFALPSPCGERSGQRPHPRRRAGPGRPVGHIRPRLPGTTAGQAILVGRVVIRRPMCGARRPFPRKRSRRRPPGR